MRIALPLALGVLVACNGPGTDTDTDNGTDDGPKVFEDFINTTVAPQGDFSCYTPGDPWIEQQVDPARVVVGPVSGHVLDFQSDDPVEEATVQVWLGNQVTGTPDSSTTSDQDGAVTVEAQACAPFAYKAFTNPDLEATVDTYQSHTILDADQGTGVEFLSVSVTTYRLIPSILGLSVQAGHAVIAGRAYDCNREPVEGAQVIVRDRETGDVQQDQVVRYFVDDFPNRDQPHTSADGLWNAIDVATGSYVVEMWIYDGDEHVLIGATEIDIVPDSINISNTYVGFGDGIRYPQSCLVTES